MSDNPFDAFLDRLFANDPPADLADAVAAVVGDVNENVSLEDLDELAGRLRLPVYLAPEELIDARDEDGHRYMVAEQIGNKYWLIFHPNNEERVLEILPGRLKPIMKTAEDWGEGGHEDVKTRLDPDDESVDATFRAVWGSGLHIVLLD